MRRWRVILRSAAEALGILAVSVWIFWVLAAAFAFVVWVILRLFL